jgi:hypothetical protein
LIWFAKGVACASLGFGFAYLTHYTQSRMTTSQKHTWNHPFVVDGPTSWRWRWVGYGVHAAALIVAVLSLIAFIGGILDVRDAIVHLGG